jgi:hypothetical protein
MKEATILGQELQSEADDEIKSSWRFPLLREMTLLYKDRFDRSEPPKSTHASQPTSTMYWFNHDLHDLYNKIVSAKGELIEKPQEYKSVWWRLSNEAAIESALDSYYYGYQVEARFTNNTFELPIVDAFHIAPTENLPVTTPQYSSI